MSDEGTQGEAAAVGSAERQRLGGDAAEREQLRGDAAGDSAERQRLEGDFLLAMRRVGSIMQLLGQVSAERIGVNATDLNCLNIVALTGSMSAGDLARATGLTTASITQARDRPEEGGFVQRQRAA